MDKKSKQQVVRALNQAAEILEARALSAAQDPSILAGDILRQGLDHKAIKTMLDSSDVAKALATARKRQKGLESVGSQDISAPALLHSIVLPALEDFHKEVGLVLDQIRKRVPKSSIR